MNSYVQTWGKVPEFPRNRSALYCSGRLTERRPATQFIISCRVSGQLACEAIIARSLLDRKARILKGFRRGAPAQEIFPGQATSSCLLVSNEHRIRQLKSLVR